MSEHRYVVAAAFAVVLLASGANRAARAQGPVDLSGTWVLDVEASEDPQEQFRRWVQARGVGGGGGGGAAPSTGSGDGGSGSNDVAGGGGGRGMAAVGGGLLGMMQRFSQNSERLTIAQGDPEVTITNAAGQANLVFTDGRLVESVAEDGGKTKVKTRWKKDKMIIDIDFPTRPNPAGGTLTPSLTMTYSLDKSGRLLLASTVGIGATVPPLTVERIYDRGQPAAPADPAVSGAPAGVPQPAEPPPG
jgi:hypothetical protein